MDHSEVLAMRDVRNTGYSRLAFHGAIRRVDATPQWHDKRIFGGVRLILKSGEFFGS